MLPVIRARTKKVLVEATGKALEAAGMLRTQEASSLTEVTVVRNNSQERRTKSYRCKDHYSLVVRLLGLLRDAGRARSGSSGPRHRSPASFLGACSPR